MPKFDPVMLRGVPYRPERGQILVMAGAGIVNDTPLLAWPLTLTTTLPVVAGGTVTPIEFADQEVMLALVPWKVTVLPPCGDPKLLPVIVTGVPGDPEVMLRLAILGGGTMAGTTTVES